MAKGRNIKPTTKPTIKKEDGVIILLLGETGAGKSSFINAAAETKLAKVGEDSNIDSCTLCVEHFVVPHHNDPQSNVIFVDTPGFNNSSPSKSDGKILKGIIDWLEASCHVDAQFGGIIYLQDLDEVHMQPKRNMVSPAKLTRPEPAGRVVLATVKGDGVLPPTAERRQEQFAAGFWEEAAEGGPETYRFMRTKDSAWRIVDTILPSKKNTIELRLIQEDLSRIYNSNQSAPNQWIIGSIFSFLFGPKQVGRGRRMPDASHPGR